MPRDAFPLLHQQITELSRIHPLDTRPHEHDQINAVKPLDVVAKALPNLSLQSMSIHGPWRDATPDCEAEPGAVQVVGADNDRKHLGIQARAPGEYRREVPPPPEPTFPPQAPIGAVLVRRRAVFVPSHAAR